MCDNDRTLITLDPVEAAFLDWVAAESKINHKLADASLLDVFAAGWDAAIYDAARYVSTPMGNQITSARLITTAGNEQP